MKIGKWEIRSQINNWEELSAQIEHGKTKTSDIISKLCHIEQLLTELSGSKRAQIEASFFRLCTETDIVMNAIMNSMKIQSDKKQSHLSIYIHEVVLAAKPSFQLIYHCLKRPEIGTFMEAFSEVTVVDMPDVVVRMFEHKIHDHHISARCKTIWECNSSWRVLPWSLLLLCRVSIKNAMLDLASNVNKSL
ncbi:hypothetical protein Tco_0299787 [Tanacetum coccineum]